MEERWRKRYSSSSNIHKINCSLLQLLNTKNRVNICTCSLILDYKISDMPSSKEKNSLNPSLRSERFAFSNLSFKVQKPRVVYFPLQCNSESFWCSTTSIKITQKNKIQSPMLLQLQLHCISNAQTSSVFCESVNKLACTRKGWILHTEFTSKALVTEGIAASFIVPSACDKKGIKSVYHSQKNPQAA